MGLIGRERRLESEQYVEGLLIYEECELQSRTFGNARSDKIEM